MFLKETHPFLDMFGIYQAGSLGLFDNEVEVFPYLQLQKKSNGGKDKVEVQCVTIFGSYTC